MRILGLDLSLTATGWAGWALHSCGVLKPPRGEDRGMERLDWIRRQVLEVVRVDAFYGSADLVVLEGYSFGSKGRATFSLGELGGVVRLALHRAGIPYVDVAPQTLKKYATGKGNAPGQAVLVEAVKRLGYEGADDNAADAMWLLAMGLDAYGQPGAPEMPQTHRGALASVDWPRLPNWKPVVQYVPKVKTKRNGAAA